jgi:D-sedoheptulose 7-phosphate isomerase
MALIKGEFLQAQKLLNAFIADENNFSKIEAAGNLLVQAFRDEKKVISCGNGGSMCDAMHFAEELSGRFRKNRKALPAVAISDPSFITCAANDFGYENVFSRYVEAFGSKGDILFAISTSGNSGNLLQAARTAKERGMNVIALTGNTGGQLAAMADIEIRVPHFEFADRTQEIHIKVIHSLIHFVEQNLFPE